MGGTINTESQEGTGSCFSIILKYVDISNIVADEYITLKTTNDKNIKFNSATCGKSENKLTLLNNCTNSYRVSMLNLASNRCPPIK